jgi:endogenous inhibitor of DNA gyrase (YacG/DUF329 family)
LPKSIAIEGREMADDTAPARYRKCPICKAQAVAGYMPFCSKRCSDIDLGKWFTNSYAIPGAAHDDDAETPAKAPQNDEDEAE